MRADISSPQPDSRLCRVCGQPVERQTNRSRRQLHEPCRLFSLHWTAAQKALMQIVFTQGGRTQTLRGDLMAMMNMVPARYHAERGPDGKFKRRGQ